MKKIKKNHINSRKEQKSEKSEREYDFFNIDINQLISKKVKLSPSFFLQCHNK
jgi:hypothetical protein